MLASKKIIAFVPTRDSTKAKAFFQQVLGLRLISEDAFALVFDANGTMLRVTPVPELKPHQFTILGWEVTDIEETVSGLQKKGVAFERYGFLKQDDLGIWSAPSGAKVAWFKDPDGNLLSLSQHT
ncbi:MAG TPA: VOC family protein [Terriglobales bacterium]|nr:VOC family protein [Terriglobales bacterium]